MIKQRIIKEELSVDFYVRKINGLCFFMFEEVFIFEQLIVIL